MDAGDTEVMYVSEEIIEGTLVGEEVAKEAEDLQTWEWAFGQTPEFEVLVERDLPGLGFVVSPPSVRQTL